MENLPHTLEDANDIIQALMLRQHELETQNQELLAQLETSRLGVEECQKHRETAHLFISAIDQSSESIFFTDVKGRILYVNRSFEETSGYSREELLGNTPRILKSGVHSKDFYKEMWATLLRGGIYHSRMINRHKDGSLYEEEARIAPVRNTTGKITNFISVKTNIAPLLETQRALETANAQLSRSNAELEQFAHAASHDLQEPLRTVTCSLQLLKKHYGGQLDGRADQFISLAVAGSHRMRNLIDDLLALSKVDAATMNLVPTDISAILQQAIENLSHAIEESGAKLSHSELPTVIAAPGMLAQLFQNLISNALKFRGNHAPVVHIAATREDSFWQFSVADQGIGIDPHHFERIFHLFERLHTRDEYPGTGLGLTICQTIVARLGGRIWLQSSPGQGSTFFFTLPADPTPKPKPDHAPQPHSHPDR